MGAKKRDDIQRAVDLHRARIHAAELLEGAARGIRRGASIELRASAGKLYGRPITTVFGHGRTIVVAGLEYEPSHAYDVPE